ncbi:family 78 glycoside hydrolase catalytic domain, partial [Maribacter sp.]|uniref:family 78 glycoside hydrolase catalytic domain n=1 Tax=Maribacter sp. TaxID=1897614 RepID=UPI0032977D2B
MKKHIYIWFITLSIFCCKAQHSSDKIDLRITKNSPIKITQVSENNYLVDFGKAFFGTVELRSTTPQNDSLIIHLGEKLNSEHRIDQEPGASIRYQKIVLPKLQANNVTSIDLIPNKKNTSGAAILLPDTIGTVMPFRYCEIENLQVPIEDIEIVQKAVHNNFNDSASYFTSSNEVLDSIWKLCKHTVKATSFTGYYVDGDRERIPYEADAYINQLSHYSVDSLYDMGRRTNAYFIKNPT